MIIMQRTTRIPTTSRTIPRVVLVAALTASSLAAGTVASTTATAHARTVAAKKPTPSYLHQFGTALFDQATKSAVDSKGNVYVLGNTLGDMDGAGPGVSAGMDAFLLKKNASGSITWIKQLGPRNEYGFALALGADDSVYVGGMVSGDLDGNGPQRDNGGLDGWLAKYSPAGKRTWLRQIGGAGNDSVKSLAVSGRTVYVIGDTANALEPGRPYLGGLSDSFVARYTTSGVNKWFRQYGSDKTDVAQSVTVGPRGLVYFAGSSEGDVDGPGGGTFNLGSQDAVLGSVKPDGSLRWVTQIGSLFADAAADVKVDSAGNVYMAGYGQGDLDGGDPRSEHMGAKDAFVAKYSSAGQQKWVTMLGTTANDDITSMVIDKKDRLFLAGTTRADMNGTFPEIYNGLADGWAGRMTAKGRLEWLYQFGGPKSDIPVSVAVSKGGAVYVAGYTNGDIDGPVGPQVQAGLDDAFLLKLTPEGRFSPS